MEKRKTLRADIILIVSLLLLSAIALTVLLVTRKNGAYVVVEQNGKEIARYSLAEDGEYALGDGSNILCVKDGKAFMTYADCPDKTCVRSGKIHNSGESITCLPNKISVYVMGSDTHDVELRS